MVRVRDRIKVRPVGAGIRPQLGKPASFVEDIPVPPDERDKFGPAGPVSDMLGQVREGEGDLGLSVCPTLSSQHRP